MIKDPAKIALGNKIRYMRDNEPEKLTEMIGELSEAEANEILYDWNVMGRPDQIIDWENHEELFYLALAGRGWGKDLCQDTDILTQNRGWIKLKDIEIGDYVYAWDGEPTKVVDFYDPAPRQLVEFTFSDNTTLVSSVEHEWITWTHQTRKCFNRNVGTKLPDDWPNWEYVSKDQWGNVRSKIAPEKRTTQDIIDTFTHGKRGDKNHSIPVALPLKGEEDTEIKDPYYIGYWLGDGTSTSPHTLTCGAEDSEWLLKCWPEFENKGNCMFRSPAGSKPEIDMLMLRGNKHIPDRLLIMSCEQRLALLQGLMDSDGYASASHVEFCSTKIELAEGVLELARSLGQKPRLSRGRATINGKDCGDKFRVMWRPANGIVPFKLPRKADKIRFGGNQESRNHHRMITDYKLVEYRPTRCISVSHKDHLFLAGKALIPTHNTRTGAEFIRDAVVNHGATNLAIIGPASKDVRNIMVNGPSGIMSVFPPDGKIQPHYSMGKGIIEFEGSDAVINCFSTEASPDSIRGGNYQFIWGDELIAWKDAEEFFNQSVFTLRMNPSRMLITTTGKAQPALIKLIKREGKDVKIIRGNTLDNSQNLSQAFINQLKETYEGTRLGKQEMGSEILLENESALWQMSTISRNIVRQEELPDVFDHITISVDPAVSNNAKRSDETGIVVVGTEGEEVYVLADFTKRMSPEEWSSKVVSLVETYEQKAKKCDVVVESNQGGNMIRDVLVRRNPGLSIHEVFATRSKYDRGVAPSLKGEQNKVKFLKEASLEELQEELITYDGTQKKSPNRFDAFNMGIHHLAPAKKSFVTSHELLI